MPYGNINVDTVTTSTTGGILGAGNASIMKNRLINGAMVISQRNGTSSTTPTTSGTYNLDRWKTILTQSSKFSIQQNAGSVTPPDGFINYAGITSLSAYSVTSTDIFSFAQAVEGLNVTDLGWGTANAKPVTISFWTRSSLTGTFSVTVSNASQARSYPATYTISVANTWEYKTITVAGDTSGTWLTTNGIGIWLLFNLGTGSTFSATANAWGAGEIYAATGAVSVVGTNGATFYITGVQLEVGSSATGYEYENYTSLLQKCQRYYSTGITGAGSRSGDNYYTSAGQHKVTMRATPTITPSATQTGYYLTSADGFVSYQSGVSSGATYFTYTASIEL